MKGGKAVESWIRFAQPTLIPAVEWVLAVLLLTVVAVVIAKNCTDDRLIKRRIILIGTAIICIIIVTTAVRLIEAWITNSTGRTTIDTQSINYDRFSPEK